jgi:geranylgeranyl diphosphate synthase type I
MLSQLQKKINQQLEVFFKRKIKELKKISPLTGRIESPLELGAILAGADQKILKRLQKYAIPLGVAFQTQDDILGIFGDEKKTSKPIGSDLKEGKQTFLIFKTKELATKNQRKIIDQALNNFNLTKNQLEKVRRIIIETGSLGFTQNLA